MKTSELLADYFDDQNEFVQRHWIVVGCARRNWYNGCSIRRNECIALCMAGGAINTSRPQQQRQQTESAQCLLPRNVCTSCTNFIINKINKYPCCAGDDVDSGCMRLQVTLAQPNIKLTFFFCFYGRFTTEKKKRNENADVFFGRQIKRRKINKMRFLAPKNKRKRTSAGLYI